MLNYFQPLQHMAWTDTAQVDGKNKLSESAILKKSLAPREI